MGDHISTLIALTTGFVLDQFMGDPVSKLHPIVLFGNCIARAEKLMNRGSHRIIRGALVAVTLVVITFAGTFALMYLLNGLSPYAYVSVGALMVFFCLSARTLRLEVEAVFRALNRSTEDGRKQLSRIVGRDTAALNPQQIRVAALETLSENLSDGVIAPLFWFAVAGLPGMVTYKMINTMDSMLGYKNERFLYFGRVAARMDDVANYIPARITAVLMMLVHGRLHELPEVFRNGKHHSSPNSGYPEAALAQLLQCRFGGPNYYGGVKVDKPWIGVTDKELKDNDLKYALRSNQLSEIVMVVLVALTYQVSKNLVGL